MDSDNVYELLVREQWVGLGALCIGLLVRLLKSEAVPPPLDRIPSKARPLIALLLGIVSGALDKVVTGTPWKMAIVGGLVSSALAVLGHDVVIEWLRKGRELGPQTGPLSVPPPPNPCAEPIEVPPLPGLPRESSFPSYPSSDKMAVASSFPPVTDEKKL